MEKDHLELKRIELDTLFDNLNLTSENVTNKAGEVEESEKSMYEIKVNDYWRQRYMQIVERLKQSKGYCPTGYKSETTEALKV